MCFTDILRSVNIFVSSAKAEFPPINVSQIQIFCPGQKKKNLNYINAYCFFISLLFLYFCQSKLKTPYLCLLQGC